MLVNILLLMRGNIGKPGAGMLPIRGHSNVQGQRTVGITEKPKLVPMDQLRELYGFHPPKEKGLNCTEAGSAVVKGEVSAVFQLGGNLICSLPDQNQLMPAWRKLRLTVQIETKLNRSCLVHGEISYILPCLGRIEIDHQASGPQAVSMEEFTACIHGSRGMAKPASRDLRSEPWIIAELAKATLAPNPKVDWDAWVADYGRIRDAIEQTYPKPFRDFNERMWQPGGFHSPLPACHREWQTTTGKANFIAPKTLAGNIDIDPERRDIFQLSIFRSQGQFNTTVFRIATNSAACAAPAWFCSSTRTTSCVSDCAKATLLVYAPRSATTPAAGSTASSCTPTTSRKDASAATTPNAIR